MTEVKQKYDRSETRKEHHDRSETKELTELKLNSENSDRIEMDLKKTLTELKLIIGQNSDRNETKF